MQTIDVILAQALPIQEALLWAEEPTHYPLVWVDTSKRPDIADLTRVHRVEGEGDFSFNWLYYDEHRPDSIFILQASFERPVRVTFWLLFPLPASVALIEAIAESSHLGVLTGTSAESPVSGDGSHRVLAMLMGSVPEGITLSFDSVSSSDLQAHIQTWRRRYPPRDEQAFQEGQAPRSAPRWWWPFGRGQRPGGHDSLDPK